MPDAPLAVTRQALHALAERVISPLRVQATGNEIALESQSAKLKLVVETAREVWGAA